MMGDGERLAELQRQLDQRDAELAALRSARPDAERAPQEDPCPFCDGTGRARSGRRAGLDCLPCDGTGSRPQGDEVETVARQLDYLDGAVAYHGAVSNREKARTIVAALDARSGADTVKLAEALKRIAYGLEYEMRDDESRYDAPRDNTWWGRIALEALAEFARPEQPSPDTLGGQPPSEREDQ